MRVGLYGGSFNPVHNGHIITAVRAAELRSLDKIILMPAYISPLRQDVDIIPGQHRVEMLQRAVDGDPLFEVSDFELKRGGVSYTIDTVRFLKRQYPEIELIIGYDNFTVLDKWREPEELLQLAQIIVLRRDMHQDIRPGHDYSDRVISIETPFIEISSTDIRARIKKGKSIDYLTPPGVVSYIREHKLYV
jgi:nicotinate-nucleotide adenylyltransferase